MTEDRRAGRRRCIYGEEPIKSRGYLSAFAGAVALYARCTRRALQRRASLAFARPSTPIRLRFLFSSPLAFRPCSFALELRVRRERKLILGERAAIKLPRDAVIM